MKNEIKKILIIAATHGNEKIGVQIIKKLQAKKLDVYFDYLIANPKALQEKKEFIDVNLNRVYPGKKESALYEKRLAYDNLKIAKKYRYVIDLHEASKGKDDFVIIPREKISPLFPIGYINLEKVILWPDPKGPISQVLECAIELEFGMKNRNRNEAIEKATGIIEKFINRINSKNYSSTIEKEIYKVFGTLSYDDNKKIPEDLVDFKLTTINNEKFYPLLFEQYFKQKIMCYKMKKISK